MTFIISSCFIIFFFFFVLISHSEQDTLIKLVSEISWPPSQAPGPSHESLKYAYNEASVFNVLTYGAIGDGVSDDTKAFKMAWDAACQSENDRIHIIVPYNFTFMIQSAIFTGPCKSLLTFQIEGTIMPPDGPDSWPVRSSKKQWLVFYRINGMLMQGGGLIDGRGDKWWDLPCKPHKGVNGKTLPGPCDSPVAIRFFTSSNLTVKELVIKNSPQFHFRFDACQNVHIEKLTIKAPALSPNTDGIHIENSNNVKIQNSLISNGDDCISIGAGCYNVDISNITCGPSHGISIGSLGVKNSKACVSNITVRNSLIIQSDNGVRIKTWQGGYGSVSNVVFKNIRVDKVRNPIFIDQYYCLTKNCPNQTSAVFITDISYTDIKGTYDVRSPPVHIACSDSIPCRNLTLSGIEMLPFSQTGRRVSSSSEFFCWNAYGTVHTGTVPTVNCLLDGVSLSGPKNDAYHNQC